MEHLDVIPGLLRGKGIEIGAFKTPLPFRLALVVAGLIQWSGHEFAFPPPYPQ
jgi:hypothetical protein